MPTSRDTVNLPILPIPAVLFPGMPLALTLSDQAYHLVRECADLDTALAISPARPVEHDGWPEPSAVGTSARVLEMGADGTGHVLLMGIARLSLLSYRHNGRNLVGQFRYLTDSDDTVPAPLIDEARALGSELWALMTPHRSHPVLPSVPQALSYWIAAHIPLGQSVRQELLEIRSTRARMAKEISIMRTLMDELQAEHSR
ncbi:MAG: LON peptidase substrate-binding domain-containing protein [Thermaerobacter sp.]|nr:LON peptidase substrate-binding domain-containing protein [Thermaerobacter sp.]